MSFLIRTGVEEVVNVGEAEGKSSNYLIDEALECLGVFQSKWHPSVLKQAKRSDNGGFRDVVRMDWDLVKLLHQVNARDVGGASEL